MSQDIHGRIQLIDTDIDHLAHDGSKQVGYGASMCAPAFIFCGDTVWRSIQQRGKRTSASQNAAASRAE
ncbi:MAG: hypothetical protein IKJ29_09060 [Akkermansia sp.]|nr:hypothetical protein [Akkermansia sp.]